MKIFTYFLVFLFCLSATPSFLSASNTIEITCQKAYYKPDVIRVKKGEPLILIVTATDVTHGFAIDEYEIAKEVAPGRPVRIEFTPDRAGEFYFYCVVRCSKKHKEMRGKLIVE
ncbi:MAG: cupredoxin domain-containing protein [Acidobacteriota bacterium]